jgi:hypothetical protein
MIPSHHLVIELDGLLEFIPVYLFAGQGALRHGLMPAIDHPVILCAQPFSRIEKTAHDHAALTGLQDLENSQVSAGLFAAELQTADEFIDGILNVTKPPF